MGMFSSNEKSDLEKMGIRVFEVFKSQGKWVFEHNGTVYDFAPAMSTDTVLSPVVVGADRLINLSCKGKGIKEFEEGFKLLVSDGYFPACDLRLEYKEPMYDGWLYNVFQENMSGFMPGQQTWLCPYIKFYYPEPPKVLYLKMSPNSEA